MTQFVKRSGMTLHRLARGQRAAITQAAKRHFPWRFMLDVILLRNDRPTGFEHQRAQAELGQFLRGPAAGHAGADDDGVEIEKRHTGAQPS